MTRKEMFGKHKYKIISLFIGVFCITCLNLCAEEVSIAKAGEYRRNLVTEAKKYIGCPYVYGATGPESFDCSGLIYFVAHQANGTQLPRTAKALYNKAKHIEDKDKEAGDLLFFSTTSSGNVSHVGIYIGNNQFISALSDGPNTGVILSSLNEAYWKPRYIGAGQIYRSTKDAQKEQVAVAKPADTKSEKDNSGVDEEYDLSSYENKGSETKMVSLEYDSILEYLTFDSTLSGNWAVLNSESIIPSFRGIDFQVNARLSEMFLEPGISVGLKWNRWLECFQFPVNLTFTVNDFIRVYLGPVFTAGSPVVKDSKKAVSASIFPGVIGASFTTPSLSIGDVKIQLAQDIHYSVFNERDNSALNFVDSLTTGLVLSTGVRVSLPGNIFL